MDSLELSGWNRITESCMDKMRESRAFCVHAVPQNMSTVDLVAVYFTVGDYPRRCYLKEIILNKNIWFACGRIGHGK